MINNSREPDTSAFSKFNCTLLLTSAGGLTGTYLAKHLKKNSRYRIIAIDMSNLTALKNWVDSVYIVPSVKDNNYISIVKNIIINEKVDIIIPVTSYDIDIYSQCNVQREFKYAKILTMDMDDHILLSNKSSCYEYLRMHGIKTPQEYGSIEEAKYPCILKPIQGSGSKNTIKIDCLRDYKYWADKISNHFLTEYIDGKEYTVDCLFNKNGRCLGANVRERVKTNGGGSVITRNDYTQNIDQVIDILEKTGKIKGPINFQYKRQGNGECCIFDFNTRFASGGLPLTVESGFDIPSRLIQIIRDEQVERWYPNMSNHGLTMIRYYEEYFVNTL